MESKIEKMRIDKESIKILRANTSAGIKACQDALEEAQLQKQNPENTNLDLIDLATEILRKRGIINAAKKFNKSAVDGAVGIKVNSIYTGASIKSNVGIIIELNAETDFVAKNDKFQFLLHNIIDIATQLDDAIVNDIEKLSKCRVTIGVDGKFILDSHLLHKNNEINSVNDNDAISIQDVISQHISIVGENIVLRRSNILHVNHGIVAGYIHNAISLDAGTLGVLVGLELDNPLDNKNYETELNLLGKQIAMHIAAAKPDFINIADINTEIITKERNIFKESVTSKMADSKKPAEVIERIIDGMMNKMYEETVLMEQNFLLDNKTKIKNLLVDYSKRIGRSIVISGFTRFNIGEPGSICSITK